MTQVASKNKLQKAVEAFLALIDGDGYSNQQYDDALAAIREAVND